MTVVLSALSKVLFQLWLGGDCEDKEDIGRWVEGAVMQNCRGSREDVAI